MTFSVVGLRRALLVSGMVLSLPAAGFAAGALRVVQTSQVPVPGDGRLIFVDTGPILNATGEMILVGNAVSPGTSQLERGVFFRATNGTVTELLGDPRTLPDGTSVRYSFQDLVFSDSGQAAFIAGNGIARANASGFDFPVRTGQAIPDRGGTFAAFDVPTVNASAHLAFRANSVNTPTGATGVYLADASGVHTVARVGDASPSGPTFSDFTRPAINNAGALAFRANIAGDPEFDEDRGEVYGLFRGSSTGTVTQVARAGQTVPGFSGTLARLPRDPSINDVGQVAFFADFATPTGDRSLLRADGATLTTIARTGQNTSAGFITLSNVFNISALNNNGQLAFAAGVGATAGVSVTGNAVYRGDGTNLLTIARSGQTLPDGSGTFGDTFSSILLNDAGQMVFTASVIPTGSTTTTTGFFFYDDQLGLGTILRYDQTLLGSTVFAARYSADSFVGGEASSLNARGDFAFSYDLDNGTGGVAIFSIPEPASLGLLAGGIVILLRRSRSR